MFESNYLSGSVNRIGRLKGDKILSSLKIGKKTIINPTFPSLSYVDLLKEGGEFIVGYENVKINDFWYDFKFRIFNSGNSIHQQYAQRRREGNLLGEGEVNKIFYIRNLNNDEEIFSLKFFPTSPKLKKTYSYLRVIFAIPIFMICLLIYKDAFLYRDYANMFGAIAGSAIAAYLMSYFYTLPIVGIIHYILPFNKNYKSDLLCFLQDFEMKK